MATKFCGKDLLIQLEDVIPSTFTTIGGFRSNGVTINNEQVDVTDKGTMPWRQLIECGIRTMSLAGSGVFTDDEVMKRMVAHSVTDGETIQNFKIISGAGDTFEGLFQIASLERTGEHNGAEEFSLTLESAGIIAYTPAP